MQVNQLFELVNNVTKSVLGETIVVKEDLSNVVSLGEEIINSDNVDNYVKTLVNHIGKVVFTNRTYKGGVPSVLMDSWEYGSILEKITAELPQAQANETWELENGKDYSPDVFYKPEVSAKFFNSMQTFEIPLSFTEIQVKESFSSANQLNGFISMLTTSVENAMTIRLDGLIMRTIGNMIGETLAIAIPKGTTAIDTTKTDVKAVNLIKLYNTDKSDSDKVTKNNCLHNPSFIRYAIYIMGLYSDRMSRISTLFNTGGKERFTPKESQYAILLSDFSKASETFLRADIQNIDKVILPKHDSVPYWQGSGTDYSFSEVSRLNIKTASGRNVNIDGLIGVIFDRDAMGVTNLERRVTTNYNPKAEFYTNFYKFEAGYYNDLNENCVIFFLGDEPVVTP